MEQLWCVGGVCSGAAVMQSQHGVPNTLTAAPMYGQYGDALVLLTATEQAVPALSIPPHPPLPHTHTPVTPYLLQPFPFPLLPPAPIVCLCRGLLNVITTEDRTPKTYHLYLNSHIIRVYSQFLSLVCDRCR